MSLFCLNVDFEEKDIVKKLGALWCNELKTLYINDKYVNPIDFIKWIPEIIDNEFACLYGIDFEDSDCNCKVVMKVKSKNDLSNYKYYFDKKKKCWKKNYYLNFQYFDSRYPNIFDKKVEQLVANVRNDKIMDRQMIERFVSIFLKKKEMIPIGSFQLRKKDNTSTIEYFED